MNALQVIWYVLIGVLLTGYAILDGFDLGVGFWHLFTKKNEDRKRLLNAIGPLWDGNEVWLLTGGGALFAAFPHVYATVFSGFYLALMLVIFALIFRAVSIEFRSKNPSSRWQKSWDIAFAAGSIIPALLFGVAVGNILRGLPLDANMNFIGTFFDLLNPYSLLVGLLGLAMFATHGAMFIVLRTEGELADNAKNWGHKAWIVYFTLFLVTTVVTVLSQGHLLSNWITHPLLCVIPLLVLLLVVLIGMLNKNGQSDKAFIMSSLSILGMMAIAGISLFPNLVPASNDPARSLTLMNASSSPLTLSVMLIIALIGIPLVLAYTIWTYRTFSGKVPLETNEY